MAEIPKRIFQTWKHRTLDRDPPILKHWQDTWKRYNPTYDYELWDDEDNRNFIKDNYPDFLEMFDSYPRNIERADVIRYFYLYHYGGIYADLDFECLNSFDVFTMAQDEADVILGTVHFDNEKNSCHSVPNAIMLSKPRADFFLFVMNVLKICYDRGLKENIAVEVSTGPILLKLCLLKYMNVIDEITENNILQIFGFDIFEGVCDIANVKSKILILPEYVFYPLSWENKDDEKVFNILRNPKEKFPDSYAITYWMQSWGGSKEVFK